MKYMFVSLSNPNWNAHTPDMMKKLGVVGTKWPDAGIEPRMVDGIKVWVLPKAAKQESWERKHGCTHRVMCACPGCGMEMSAGRLHQHRCHSKYSPSQKRRVPLIKVLDRMRRALVIYNSPQAYVVSDAIVKAIKELENRS